MTRAWRNAAVVAAFALLAVPAFGSTVVFATGPLNLTGGSSGRVNAEARFEIDAAADTIAISILNLQDDPASVGQLISGLSFTLSQFANASPYGSITSERATAIEIDRMGRIVEVTPKVDTDWKFLPLSGGGFELCAVCTGSGGPDELLIGGSAANGLYTSANGSIAGNKPHNPFLLASGTSHAAPAWLIHLDGIDPATAVDSATFRFGTTYGALSAKGYGEVPEGTSGGMVAIGAGLLWLARRRRSKGQKV